MAKSSSQKFIARNRAPRVQIEYDVELYGAEKKIQLPFVMGVLADLSGKPAEPLAPLFYAVKCADVIDPRDYANDPNAVKAITARYTAALENLIRKHPEQYFWLHRRWKHQPKAKGKERAADGTRRQDAAVA